MRVLIVDDEVDLLETLKLCCRSEDVTVITAKTGEEAWNLLTTSRFDGIVLDLLMPGSNGWEMIDKMEAEGIKTPVIVSSGYADVEPPSQHKKISILRKPYAFEDLLGLMKHVFAKEV